MCFDDRTPPPPVHKIMPDPVMLGSPTNTQPPIRTQVVTAQPGMIGGSMGMGGGGMGNGISMG
ncbi:hypothetical protein EON63_23840, partial [archaeon]